MLGKSLWALTIGAAILGGILLYIASRGLQETSSPQLWHDLIRDVGIALLVAAVIAAIYELHARARFDRATMTGVLGSIYNDIVDGSVWEEIRQQILDKELVRKNGQVTISLKRDDLLPKGQHIVWVEFEYDLCGLRSTHRRIELRHFLDSFMSNPASKLPRFDQIVIGDKVYKGPTLEECIDNKGVFKKKLSIDGREGRPERIVVERREIVYVPGAYNLVMGELTDGVRLHLEQITAEIEVEVNMKGQVTKLEEDGFLHCRKFFLPGQGIEFRFKPKSTMAETDAFQAQVTQIQGDKPPLPPPGASEASSSG